MLRKLFNGVLLFFKGNFVFGLGMMIGSAIGSSTVMAITMGIYGANPTLEIYRQTLCGG